jgi:hypothetical protein
MITVLVVGNRDRAEGLDAVAARNPSLELLHAADLEEAIDRLARNRRIDAVLLMVDGRRAAEIVETVLEEDPGAPPLFAPAALGKIAGIRPLPGRTPEELLAGITGGLSS